MNSYEKCKKCWQLLKPQFSLTKISEFLILRLCLENRRKLVHRKYEILVLFCAAIAKACLLYITSKTLP